MGYRRLCPVLGVFGIAAMAYGQASQPVDANLPRVVTLVLQPSKLDTGVHYSLLPAAANRKDGDGATFYNKAVKAMPNGLDMGKVWNCLQIPLSQMSQAEAEAILQQAQATLQFISQGAQCQACNWPPSQPTSMPQDLPAYRQLAALVCVKARVEIVKNQYGDAISTLRTGMSAAAHIGNAPSVVQSLVGIAMTRMMLQRVEELAQMPNSPNLYAAIKALPNPMIDVNVPIASERNSLSMRVLGLFNMAQQLTNDAEERCGRLAHRLNAESAALQCVEALRHYAATHNNQLPAQLGDIPDVQLPNDPATGKLFNYRLEGTKAILEVSPPKGGTPRDGMRYEITVAP